METSILALADVGSTVDNGREQLLVTELTRLVMDDGDSHSMIT